MKEIFYVLYFVVTLAKGYDISYCNAARSTYQLDKREIRYFWSSSYPANLDSCTASFLTKDPDDRLWVAVYNGAVQHINYQEPGGQDQKTTYFNSNTQVDVYLPASNTFNFTVPHETSPYSWSGFQAVVVTYDSIIVNECPFSHQTIDLSKEVDKVVPLTSHFYENAWKPRSCSWNFNITDGQQLKVVIMKVKPTAANFSLTLSVDGKNVKNYNTAVSSAYVDYYDGKNFGFSYSAPNSNSTDNTFILLVSVVSKPPEHYDDGCIKITNDHTTYTLSNFDKNNGYKSYQQCSLPLDIPKNNMAIVIPNSFYLETCCDSLAIVNDTGYKFADLDGFTWYRITDDLENASVEFSSDGNTYMAGFEVVYNLYECSCADSKVVVDCDANVYIGPMKQIAFYCDNMNCSYTIDFSKCPNKYFALTMNPWLRDEDLLQTFSNGKLQRNINSSDSYADSPSDLYSPDTNVTVKFLSGSGPTVSQILPFVYQWGITVSPINPPTFITVVLNDTTPTSTLWLNDLGANSVYQVCVPNGKTLEMFITDMRSFDYGHNYFTLYDSEGLINSLGQLRSALFKAPSTTQYPWSLKSESGCLALYQSQKSSTIYQTAVLFRIPEVQSKNCKDTNNIFLGYYSMPNEDPFTMEATASGSCEMIVLNSGVDFPGMTVSSLTTTGTGNFTVKSTVTQKTILSFPSADAPQWQNLGLYGSALSFIVPPSSSIAMRTRTASSTFGLYFETNSTSGVMMSPSYVGTYSPYNTSLYTITSENDMLVHISVARLNGAPTLALIDVRANNRTMLNDNGTIEIQTSKFSVQHSVVDPRTDSFLLYYSLTSLRRPASSTATSFTVMGTFNGIFTGICLFLVVFFN